MKIDIDAGSALAASGMEVWVLRNTWDTHGAYKFAMAHYYNAMKEELEVQGAQTRWHDFRVRTAMATDALCASGSNITTTGSLGFNPQRMNIFGDFSSVVDASGTTRDFVLDDTATATQYSIFLEWEKKGRVQNDPSSQEISLAYEGIVEDRDEGNYDIVRANGAAPPYSQDADDPMWVKVAVLQNNGGADGTKLTSGFFDAPLGICVLYAPGHFSASAANLEHPFTISFQSGKYKGVKAPAYATPVLTPEKKWEVV